MVTTLPGNFGLLDWSDWVYGLASAFISGGATAIAGGVAVGLTDPDHFNIHTPNLWTVMGIMFLFNGLSNGANFLRSKPLPSFKTIERVVQTKEIADKPPITVTTTKETITEALPPKKADS